MSGKRKTLSKSCLHMTILPFNTCTCVHCTFMLTELLYPIQYGNSPLHLAAREGNATCVEHLLSTPGIDVNIKGKVSQSIQKLIDVTV